MEEAAPEKTGVISTLHAIDLTLSTPWFTTDFPIVEGAQLFDVQADAPTGQLQLQQMLPIRGNYQLQVTATPLGVAGGEAIQQTMILTVPENSIKYRNKELVPCSCSEPAQKSIPATITSQGIQLAITGDNSATVGKPASFQVKAIDTKTNQPVAGTVRIQTINTENEAKWTTFGYEGAISNGEFAWQSGLFDGSGHQVDVEFTPTAVAGGQSTKIKVAQPVEVEGVAPPLYVRLISLGYMTGILASAFLLAFWLRRRQDVRWESA